MARSDLVLPHLRTGRHRSPRQGACFMEFASYLAGERWSDHPPCTHPLLAALARNVNDLVTDGSRDRLLAHVHRVIGLTTTDPRAGVLIAARAGAAGIEVASMERQRAIAVGLLRLTEAYPEIGPLAERAFCTAPDARRWASALIENHKGRSTGSLVQTESSLVHTATIGIALACIDDPDERLIALLDGAISDVETLIAGDARDSREEPHPSSVSARESHGVAV